MKIAITSTGQELTSAICPRFGRTDYFIIVDPDTLEFEVISNPNSKAVGGAGIQSSQIMINHDVASVLSGRVGMNAFRVLESAGIEVFENMEGSVLDAIKIYNEKNISKSVTAGPGLNSNKGSYKKGAEDLTAANAEEIEELKKEVDQLTKQLNEVNKKLNRLNK